MFDRTAPLIAAGSLFFLCGMLIYYAWTSAGEARDYSRRCTAAGGVAMYGVGGAWHCLGIPERKDIQP
jgi:hypothetical protein